MPKKPMNAREVENSFTNQMGAISSLQEEVLSLNNDKTAIDANQVIIDFKAISKTDLLALTDAEKWDQVFSVLKALVQETYA